MVEKKTIMFADGANAKTRMKNENEGRKLFESLIGNRRFPDFSSYLSSQEPKAKWNYAPITEFPFVEFVFSCK